MASYEVLGTKYIVSGSQKKWFVYESPVKVGDKPVAGPFVRMTLATIEARKMHNERYR